MSIALDAAVPMAFGVDPTRRERYSLRQARYHAIGEDVGRLLHERPQSAGPLKLLDVGLWNGVSMRYVESQPGAERVEFHGIDLKLQPTIYQPRRWASLQEGNLLDGFPQVASNQFDVVICEQVLEHLPSVETAMATLCRILKPGGTLIVGVPIFPPGVDLLRRHLVPRLDRLVKKRKPRGHLQAFSLRSFVEALHANCEITVAETRGFRILSGGILRPLENHRWWWQLGRTCGRYAPALCTEVQVVAVKKL